MKGMFLMGHFDDGSDISALKKKKKRQSHLSAAVSLGKQLYKYWQLLMLINFPNNEKSTKSIQKATKNKSGTWESAPKGAAGKHVAVTGR